MKKLWLLLFALPSFVLGLGAQNPYQDGGLPSNPDPNKCYVRCITPPVYRTDTVEIVTCPAYEEYTVVPARYRTVRDTVVEREAYVYYKCEPPTFKYVDEPYVYREACDSLTVKPTTFREEEEECVYRSAVQYWEYTTLENCDSEDPLDCRVLCWRQDDEKTRKYQVKRVSYGGGVDRQPGNAVNRTYRKQVIDKPAQCVEVEEPAKYRVVERQIKVSDARVDKRTIPAATVKCVRETLVEPGGLERWTEIECELLDYSVLPINYEYSSARLTYEARQIIDERLLSLLRENPYIRIEISSHTDCRGNANYNQQLSEQRAQSVVNYLKSKGIAANRLVYRGYGESRLKNRCADGIACSEEEHGVNRRTEFRVLNN